MAFRAGKKSRIYVDHLKAACYARSASASGSTDMHDVTVFCDEPDKEFIPTQATSTFSIAGPLDDDGSADGQFDTFASIHGADDPTPISFLPLGGDGHAWLIEGHEVQFETMAAHDGGSDWSMEAQTTGLTDMRGVVLEDNTEVTADTDGTAVDNGAGTAQGAVFHLHVTAFSGLTSDDITVEQSSTGAFGGEETTVATFAQVTGLTSERVEVTGTVQRHLRVVDDVAGTPGSISRFVAVSRR